jgi:quinol monooxygenase YgiN
VPGPVPGLCTLATSRSGDDRRLASEEDNVAIRVIVEMQAKPGRRDELTRLIEGIVATHGPAMRGYLGGELFEVLGDPDGLVEIADWESAEARDALMEDAAVMEAMAPLLELLAAPFRATLVKRL